jgi:hypothetical protein
MAPSTCGVDAVYIRLPFLIPLLLIGVATFAMNVWLGVGLVLLFGRAVLMGAHRRPAFGSGRSGGGSAPALVSADRGPDGDAEPGLIELLPLP